MCFSDTIIRYNVNMIAMDVAGPSQIADAANMQLNDVAALLAELLEKGIVRRVERDRYAFVDNLFKIWLKDYA
jgi:DNA-binding IclR family transcriptional regulator